MTREGFDVALICINGHVVNAYAQDMPQFSTSFCEKCGAQTIMTCPQCSTPIRGMYHHGPGIVALSTYDLPGYCHNCGKSYPWIEKRLVAAQTLIQECGESLTDEEQQLLSDSLVDLVQDTPQTPVAIQRFKRLALKAGAVIGNGLRDIMVDVASEAVKKVLWP